MTLTAEVGTSMAQTGWEARMKINPLFNPKSLKNILWALLLLVNGSRSKHNPVWLLVFSPVYRPCPRLSLPNLPGAQQLSVGGPAEQSICLHLFWSSPHNTLQSPMIRASVSLKLNIYHYYLFIDGFGEFYFVFVEFEWSTFASICFGLRCCPLVRQLLVLNVVFRTFKSYEHNLTCFRSLH